MDALLSGSRLLLLLATGSSSLNIRMAPMIPDPNCAEDLLQQLLRNLGGSTVLPEAVHRKDFDFHIIIYEQK